MMKKFNVIMGIGLLSLSVIVMTSSLVLAEDKGSMKGSSKGSMVEDAAVNVGNKICPVSKEKLGGMGKAFEYEHNGKIYNLCCKGCLKDFKKDPEKYIKIIEEQMEEEASMNGSHKGSDHEGHDH